MNNDKFKLQSEQYSLPYHYCVSVDNFSLSKSLDWGLEYYSYIHPVVDYIKTQKFNSLLDVGCGDGFLINNISYCKKNSYFKGIDLVDKAVLFAKAFNRFSNVEFKIQDIKDEKNIYDIVTLIHVLEHIPNDMEKFFLNIVLQRVSLNGAFIISVPSKNMKVLKKHFRHYSEEEIYKLIPNDFKLVKKMYHYNMDSLLVKFINKLLVNKLFLLNNSNIINFLINYVKHELFDIDKNKKYKVITLVFKKY